jgi:hypothetical protein
VILYIGGAEMKRLVCAIVLGVVAAGLLAAVSSAAAPGVGTPDVTIDFSNNAQGDLDPLFYQSDGVVFPPQRCGTAGCSSWFVGFIQGDNALVGNPLLGGITATFTRPVSKLSFSIAPGSQGTAVYTLTAFSASGNELASQSLTVIQDSGDRNTGPPGYFTMSLGGLPEPAKSFTLTNAFVRSSFGTLGPIEFGVSSISYTHWGKPT